MARTERWDVVVVGAGNAALMDLLKFPALRCLGGDGVHHSEISWRYIDGAPAVGPGCPAWVGSHWCGNRRWDILAN